jgi:predicted kinase
MIIALMGLPGAGKTTIARELVRQYGFSLLSRDEIRDTMFVPCDYTNKEKFAAYQALLIGLSTSLEMGRAVIIDGMPFSRASEVDDVRQVCSRFSADLRFVYVSVPVSVAQARVQVDLNNKIKHRTPDLVREVAERFDPIPPDAIRIDGTLPSEKKVWLIAQQLGLGLPSGSARFA